MSHTNNPTILPFEPNGEERAFLYQQVQDLESIASQFGSLSVLVEQSYPQDQPENVTYAVTFVVAPENMEFKVRGEGKNLFETCMVAKNETKAKLSELINQVPDQALAAAREQNMQIPPERLH
jgi:hypothetical protein